MVIFFIIHSDCQYWYTYSIKYVTNIDFLFVRKQKKKVDLRIERKKFGEAETYERTYRTNITLNKRGRISKKMTSFCFCLSSGILFNNYKLTNKKFFSKKGTRINMPKNYIIILSIGFGNLLSIGRNI